MIGYDAAGTYNNSAETMDRIINMFPQDQHKQIFLDLSQYLRAVCSQRLVVTKEGKRIAAIEAQFQEADRILDETRPRVPEAAENAA